MRRNDTHQCVSFRRMSHTYLLHTNYVTRRTSQYKRPLVRHWPIQSPKGDTPINLRAPGLKLMTVQPDDEYEADTKCIHQINGDFLLQWYGVVVCCSRVGLRTAQLIEEYEGDTICIHQKCGNVLLQLYVALVCCSRVGLRTVQLDDEHERDTISGM